MYYNPPADSHQYPVLDNSVVRDLLKKQMYVMFLVLTFNDNGSTKNCLLLQLSYFLVFEKH